MDGRDPGRSWPSPAAEGSHPCPPGTFALAAGALAALAGAGCLYTRQAGEEKHRRERARVHDLLQLARKKVCVKDLQTALSMCEEALKTDPAYAGDVYFTMAVCHKSHAVENKLPYAQQLEHSRNSVSYYESAVEAYKQPGAETTFPEATERRIARSETVIKWEKTAQEWWKRCIEAGKLGPFKPQP